MTVSRGEVWLADLNPTKGSEQAGVRPVIVFQNNTISKFSTTVLTIPLTTNLRRAALPTSVQINKGEQVSMKRRLRFAINCACSTKLVCSESLA